MNIGTAIQQHPCHFGPAMLGTPSQRLAIVEDASGTAQKIQTRVHEGVEDAQWTDTLNEIVNSISGSLKKLDREKRELENFIVNVTEQLGEVTRAIAEDQTDLQSNQADTQSLQSYVREGMSLIEKNVQSTTDLQLLKSGISNDVD